MTTNIYILKLQKGKYYVGKTENPMKRYQEHLNGQGSTWTRKYRPVQIQKIISNASPFDEDRYVKELMVKYGMQNVRGGSYVQEELSEFQTEALKMEIWSAKDKCSQCGRSGHWVKDCYAKTDVSGKDIEESEEEESEDDIIICGDCNKEFSSQFTFNKHKCKSNYNKSSSCFRCGRTGHYASDCYAGTHKKGYVLDP